MPIQTATFTAQMKTRSSKRRRARGGREQEAGWQGERNKGEATGKGKRGKGWMNYAEQRESEDR